MSRQDTIQRLKRLQRRLGACTRCPQMIGPVVHGPPVPSRVLLVGQAPGAHEGEFGRPFAWTAGRTLFNWFQQATGADEDRVRERIYFAAVARCFPGKARGGGDRRPGSDEVDNCRQYLEREVDILRPELVIPVGTLAIAQVAGHTGKLTEVVGKCLRQNYFGHPTDMIALPHPSGASTWHRTEPGVKLLRQALELLAGHRAVQDALQT